MRLLKSSLKSASKSEATLIFNGRSVQRVSFPLQGYMWWPIMMLQGDVYHLVFELGEWLDGRVWPSTDELDVLRLVDFIEHVTGMCPGNSSVAAFMWWQSMAETRGPLQAVNRKLASCAS